MKRSVQLVGLLVASTSIGGCVSAKQKKEEQQEIERSIRTSSDADAIKDCAFIMNLRPDRTHNTPEAQAASLVIPKPGVSWVVFDDAGKYELYSCSQRSTSNDSAPGKPTPTTIAAAMPNSGTEVPSEAKATPAPSVPAHEIATTQQPERRLPASGVERSVSDTRVTSNPEAVKGCKFLASFAEYRTVLRFQEDVVKAGGNLGYVVATNKDGDIIGESYLCSDEAKP